MKHRGSSVHVRRPTVPDRCGPGASGGRGAGTDARSAAGRVGRRHAVTRGARTGRRVVARHPAPVIRPVPSRCLPVATTPRVAHAHASPTAEPRPHAPAGQTVVSAVLARWAPTVTVLSSGPRPMRTVRVTCTACSDRGVPAAHRSTPSSRFAPSRREELPGRSPGPAIRCAVAGRHPVASSRAGIPSRRWGAASCRVLGSRCPVASWGVGVLSLGSGATSRSAARARHDSGGVTSGACGVATARPSLSRVSSPVGCRRSCRSLQRTSDTENDTDGDSDSGRGGAVGRDGARLLPRARSRASPQRG